jgi:hypothetical protein
MDALTLQRTLEDAITAHHEAHGQHAGHLPELADKGFISQELASGVHENLVIQYRSDGTVTVLDTKQ